MKLSELLYKYAIETAQNKVSNKTAEQFLILHGIENKKVNQVIDVLSLTNLKTMQPKNDSK